MSIAAEIESLVAAKHAIKAAIEAKNPTVAPTDALAQWPDAIASIPTGGGFPECLQLVQYLESTGTQHVDTGVVPAASHIVRCRFQTDDYYSLSSTNCFPFSMAIGRTVTGIRYATNNALTLLINSTNVAADADDAWHDGTLELTGATPSMWLDGFKVGERSGAFVPPSAEQQDCRYKLFCHSSSAGTISGNGTGKIAAFSIQDSGTGETVIDLAPARIKAGVGAGLGVFFDRVSGKVYLAGGDDPLVIGPDEES